MSNSREAGPRPAHPAVAAAVGHWTLDPERSTVRFRNKTYWGLSSVQGRFRDVTGSGEVLPDGRVRGTLTVRTASLDTAHGKRDEHLRGVDFFHTDEHPELVFAAESVAPSGDDTARVSGTLTVRGTPRPLTFTAHVTGAYEHAVTLEAELVLDRADFSMTWNRLGMISGPAVITVAARYLHGT